MTASIALVGKRDVIVLQAVFGRLLLDQELLGDIEFFDLGVAVDLDDLHPVLQRFGNIVQEVCRRNEHYLRKVIVQVEVVVVKRVVLLRVQHLEQRRRRIAAEIGAHLVHLVHEVDGVGRF